MLPAALALAALTTFVACGEADDEPGTALPRATATADPAADDPPAGQVAVPTCLGPEVKPENFTSTCADAGYQLDLTWDAWGTDSATAHGTASVSQGPKAGWRAPMRVVFDAPRAVPEAKGRHLFTRAVVTYPEGKGPSGKAKETLDLSDQWAFWAAMDSIGTECDPQYVAGGCPTPSG